MMEIRQSQFLTGASGNSRALYTMMIVTHFIPSHGMQAILSRGFPNSERAEVAGRREAEAGVGEPPLDELPRSDRHLRGGYWKRL